MDYERLLKNELPEVTRMTQERMGLYTVFHTFLTIDDEASPHHGRSLYLPLKVMNDLVDDSSFDLLGCLIGSVEEGRDHYCPQT